MIYFHLGLPKVASTFLQLNIFPYFKGLEFNGKHRFEEFRNYEPSEESGDTLFSSEFDRGLEDVVDAAVERFPEAKFFLMVRRHDKWLVSRYKYYIRKHGHKSFEEFIDLDNNRGEWKLEELMWSKKLQYILEKSNNDCLFLRQKDLRKYPDFFYQKLSEFLGHELSPKAKKNKVVNKSFKTKQLLVLRRFNRAYRYEELRTNSRFVNRLHYRYRQYLLHIIAFFAQFLPSFMIPNEPFIEDETILDRVMEYYRDDWNACLKLVKQTAGSLDGKV
jgi:hypothetical protein